ncbi:MAG: phosphotransferase [Acidobacteriota bacterium]|nr:phosphotransferase [Acidobacteriota bacterium]
MPLRISPLGGDVSHRRYFRLLFDDGATAIGVHYPVEMRSTCRRFLATTALLEGGGIRVPSVLHSECDSGFSIVEDLGSTSLYDLADRPWTKLRHRFEAAMATISRIQRLPAADIAHLNPELGADALQAEVDLAWTRLLSRPEISGDAELRSLLAEALDATCRNLGAAPLIPCHRDFMARNLMIDSDGRLALIDHQDLRLGPRFYDLASLLNDSLYPPRSEERHLRNRAIQNAEDLLVYRRCVVQRTLKAAATFVSFAGRGHDRHLPLVRPTLARAAHHLERLPEGGPFATELARRWHALDVTALSA